MDGYLDDTKGYQPVDKAGRRSWWKTILWTLAYMIPLFLLWSSTDFPDGLGVHIAAHGEAGLLENWYYSYLLIQRHHALDVLTFLYMWAPIVGIAGWFAFRKLRHMKFSLYSDDTE
jgi:hypothetical protein